ncbi:MAG: hypothetical protein RSB71_00770 [Bacilli bacterium]
MDKDVKGFIEKTTNYDEKTMDELIYYCQQGIAIGKEEATLDILYKMVECNIDKDLILKITGFNPDEVVSSVK